MWKCESTLGMQYGVSDDQLTAMRKQANSETEHEDGAVTLGFPSGATIHCTPITPQAPTTWTLIND